MLPFFNRLLVTLVDSSKSNMNQTTKRYLISSAVTFLTAMAVVILANIDNITLQSFQDGSIISIMFVAARGGVKALLEFLVGQTANQQ